MLSTKLWTPRTDFYHELLNSMRTKGFAVAFGRRIKPYCYAGSCVIVDDIDGLKAMLEQKRRITYPTFQRHCHALRLWARLMEYDRTRAEGLTLRDDRHVQYYRSRFRQQICYFLRHSGVEHIWMPEDDAVP